MILSVMTNTTIDQCIKKLIVSITLILITAGPSSTLGNEAFEINQYPRKVT